ncbi:hypothetical protein MPSEU_000128200 [Mayamaea pseudoterrestris]|nr:hypothetical protein MPSEU_000128200 [Mayamaea pseudoterrestris]
MIMLLQCVDSLVTVCPKTKELVKKLEKKLGPDTAELHMRVGIHSGSVTGGVLRGAKSRFQLFGDAMNMCARIETNGEKGRVHLSQATADALLAAGKDKWFIAREEKVYAKGKGELQTYWLKVGKKHHDKSKRKSRSRLLSTSNIDTVKEEEDGDEDLGSESIWSEHLTSRLIDWNVDNLLRLLKEVIASKRLRGVNQETISVDSKDDSRIPLDDLKECLEFDPLPRRVTPSELALVQLDQRVVSQLHDFCTNIAIMYKDNAFNNFERASQMLLAVTKFVARVDEKAMLGAGKHFSHDPLAVFACAFSAIVRDIDHPGVSNKVLAQENEKMSKHFRNTSIAEQNSFDLAFGLLMDNSYSALRAALFSSQSDLIRFRHIAVNLVLSSDISRLAIKNQRWEQALLMSGETAHEQNYRASIVCEFMLAATEIIHTMQHVEIYNKWNERLFSEHHAACRRGRVKDPSASFFNGQLKNFDGVVIPLAEKLSNCGVFGSLGSECLASALSNRQCWHETCIQLVATMAEQHAKTDNAPSSRISPISVAIDGLRQREKRPAHDSEKFAAESSAHLEPKNDTDKNLKGIAKRATSSNFGSAMSLLMNQVDAMQKMEEHILTTSLHECQSYGSSAGVSITGSDDDGSAGTDESFSMDGSINSHY